MSVDVKNAVTVNRNCIFNNLSALNYKNVLREW